MRLSVRETTRHELRRHSLGGQGCHKQGTLAGAPDKRHTQPSRKRRATARPYSAQTSAQQGILCYGPPPVRRLSTSGTARLAGVLASLTVVAAVPVALGADSSNLRSRVAELRAQESTTRTQAHAAVLTLYALETELTRARGDLAAAESRRAAIAAERISVGRRLELAQSAMGASERRLADVVRELYQRDTTEPLAILLGAGSLDEALTGLDNLDRASGEHRRVLERAGISRSRFARLEDRLDAQAAELVRLSEVAQERLRALEGKVAERAAYIGSLRQRQSLTAREITALEGRAQAAAQQASELPVAASRFPGSTPARSEPAAVSVAAAATATGPRTLTVSAIAYSLRGRTASGLPVGPGIAAVDPSVIPLGTRMFVPGYGEAVAADTGAAIRGAVIDLWFPTTAAALRWGRQTVVIQLR